MMAAMETAPEMAGHATLKATRSGRSKVQLLTRDHLDGRTRARKQFDAIADGVANDLGGPDQLSVIQKHLIEAFAGSAVVLQGINARMLLGEPIDVLEQCQAASIMVRLAQRIGLDRVPRDVGPDLGELMRADITDRRREATAATDTIDTVPP
jgi:hypothetical protein